MTEEIQMALDHGREQMDKALDHLRAELNKIRAGKAHPSMLGSVQVDYYGSMTPLSQVANVSTPDPRTLTVQPWEKGMLDPISTAIINANLGLNPQNNGEVIMINVPTLTEERRKDLTRMVRAEGEHAKVSIRNARKEANDAIKAEKDDGLSEDMAKKAEQQVQDLTNQYAKKVDDILEAKEADIMTI